MTVIDDWADYMTATGAAVATVTIRRKTIAALMRQQDLTDPLTITRTHVVRFLARDIAPWSRITYWKSIRSFNTYLIDFDLATEDLLKGIPKPSNPDAVARPIDDLTIERLLRAQLTPRARAYVLIALYAGLRVHEIAKLRGEDFDLTAGWLMIAGKGGITKPVPLHPELLRMAESMPEFGWWFPSNVDTTRAVRPEAVSQTIIGALRSIGCKATAHQLRDTAATMIQRKGKDIRVTQTLLRHRSVVSTQKYTAVADESMQDAILLLNWDAA